MVYEIIDDVDTTDLGNVQTDSGDESNGLIAITLPESASSDALLIPTTGPSSIFNISSIKTGSVSTLRTFIAKLTKWTKDSSSLGKPNLTYNSDLDGTGISVRATRYSKNWEAGNPQILRYSIELIKGTFV